MNRTFHSFSITDLSETKLKMLSWCNRFNISAFLDNHRYQLPGHSYECLVACGSISSVTANAGNALQQLQSWINLHQGDWMFGHLAYDLKNETEQLSQLKEDVIGFDDLTFFVPQYVFQLSETEIQIGSLQQDHATVFAAICAEEPNVQKQKKAVDLQQRVSKDQYISQINSIREHIIRGDCYELNYCMEFYNPSVVIDPVSTCLSLAAVSPNPFSAFYKVNNSYLLCASPERFLQKQGNQLLSQPMKGTLQRNLTDAATDEELKTALHDSVKDRSENVMVVDLVRNDLSRVCNEGSVKVDELFAVYTFPQVHQMISTVSGEVNPALEFTEIIQAAFPMGSMTGAPKRKVMELIDAYEPSRRGLFSGAVGYIAPNGDFDFNVVIRSLLYNASTGYLSYQVGSGITFYSNAENEYQECLWKGQAIRNVLHAVPL